MEISFPRCGGRSRQRQWMCCRSARGLGAHAMRALSSMAKKRGPSIRARADRSEGAIGIARTVRNRARNDTRAHLTFDLEPVKCKTYFERSAIKPVQQIRAGC